MKVEINITVPRDIFDIGERDASLAFGKIFATRGYIVIGQPPPGPDNRLYKIGEHIQQIFQYQTRRTFVVTQRTTVRDMREQLDLLCKQNPTWKRRVAACRSGGTYFRILPLAVVRAQKKLRPTPKRLKAGRARRLKNKE